MYDIFSEQLTRKEIREEKKVNLLILCNKTGKVIINETSKFLLGTKVVFLFDYQASKLSDRGDN